MPTDSTEFAAQLRPRLASDPLWEFALALYARPGVEPSCLILQDEHGWDVCELIWRCWLFRHGATTGPVPADVSDWQQTVTVPLRQLRRQLKRAAQHEPSIASVRSSIQRAELEAERQCLEMLMKISLEGLAFTPLPEPRPRLEKVLLSCSERQKKTQFTALRSMESQLDPLPSAR
ncbi:TIGR02444 family protein [Halomonas denitrificans]|uniref:TIGR02444 family protein n=1 Tax=Halomonas TaxID=2745 RepID=UPI001A8CF37E|nr:MULTISPECIES: TIGR02444 family protein [Halomonas]MED5296598.1 TIGR02444 family protein [Pseudomonadota bacterium]MBN8412922.1 TIGR02444 family protein [Halomonas litopenaei]MBY5983638.1 TIGR02444 family protein [Halomonas sp. DP5Y7-2]MBY6031336.1 TIGR02444 family protein [Halomonas sp. DP8Y7-1]MCA0974032.1 TIGR02444 family protein [Halomonas denitrificans]